ncbi:hypothetical protein M5E88_11595 [Akkermansia muciniphila]|nr:hypothetical protein M5E88_11595 [Akkermansia muciniphila]
MASAGNDHRLGANEAPPAIISIFLGAQLNEVIENMINGSSGCGKRNDTLKIGVDTLPVLPRDATDRNRTSPFAFTGNKFEFRAPGSAQSCAGPMMTLNTIVAESLDSLAEELSSFAPETFLPQLQETLKRRISEHKRIIFNGDNYSEEWVKEAERRGLPNLKNTMTALHTLVNEKNVALFEKYGVFSRRELESRFEIFLEEYHRRIRIEGRLSWEMAATIILPALRNEYGQTVSALSRALEAKRTSGAAALQKLADKLGDALDSIVSDLDTLETALTSCHEDILAAMSRLRTSVDAAETLVNDRSWPLPSTGKCCSSISGCTDELRSCAAPSRVKPLPAGKARLRSLGAPCSGLLSPPCSTDPHTLKIRVIDRKKLSSGAPRALNSPAEIRGPGLQDSSIAIMPKDTSIKKILVIGSGPIVIGQGCEFDYSGTQACKALREEGYEVVLVNSNPATIMTDPETSPHTYIEPITPEFVEKIIIREKPDALLPTLGGQTALNCAMELHRSGVLEREKVRMIGANADAIDRGEDRNLFKEAMLRIGLDVPRSGIAHTMEEARRVAGDIGSFP